MSMPGQTLFADNMNSPRYKDGSGSSAGDSREELSAIMGRRGVRAAPGVTKFDLSSSKEKQARLRREHGDLAMIDEDEHTHRRNMNVQSISDLAHCANIPLAGPMELPGE